MKIKAEQKLRLFSHLPGTRFLVPGTLIEAIFFPARLELGFLDLPQKPLVLDLELLGPVRGFTVFQDLKEAFLEVQGFSLQGFFRYRLFVKDNKLQLLVLKAPQGEFFFQFQNEKKHLALREAFALPLDLEEVKESEKLPEILCLGQNKHLDRELLKRRFDLRELLPLWFKLGQMTPQRPLGNFGTLRLVDGLERAVSEKNKNEAKRFLELLLQAGFQELFIPRLFDPLHQGIVPLEKKASPASSAPLLSKGSELIRRLFFQEEAALFRILPVSWFFSGRLVNLKTAWGLLHLEWTKKLLKKMVLETKKSGSLQMVFSSQIVSFRLRSSLEEKGVVYESASAFELEEGKRYFFDHFQK
ncbi:MAG: hypothetical protein WC371_04800 [Parachlamydiales bacterium]